MDSKYYQHKDFYLCAYLIVQNCRLINHERIGNSTTFTFLDSVELRKNVDNYLNMRALVDAISYAAAIRNLKTMIHSNRAEATPALTTFSKELYYDFSNKFGEKL